MGIWVGLIWSECRGGSLDYEEASLSPQATDQGLSDTHSYGIRSHYLLVGMLRVVDWYLVTEASRAAYRSCFQGSSSPRKDGTERLFQNIANVTSQKSRDLIYTAAETWNHALLIDDSWVQKKRDALPTNNLSLCVHLKNIHNGSSYGCGPKTVSWKEVWPWQGKPSSDHAVPTAAQKYNGTHLAYLNGDLGGGEQRYSQHTM